MRLSVLSSSYLSDSIADSRPIGTQMRPSGEPSVHFYALCRGVAVMIVVTLTVGLTIFETARFNPSLDADPAEDTGSR